MVTFSNDKIVSDSFLNVYIQGRDRRRDLSVRTLLRSRLLCEKRKQKTIAF